jgi:hypothetical protein
MCRQLQHLDVSGNFLEANLPDFISIPVGFWEQVWLGFEHVQQSSNFLNLCNNI